MSIGRHRIHLYGNCRQRSAIGHDCRRHRCVLKSFMKTRKSVLYNYKMLLALSLYITYDVTYTVRRVYATTYKTASYRVKSYRRETRTMRR